MKSNKPLCWTEEYAKLEADRAALIEALDRLCHGADSLAALCEWTDLMVEAYSEARVVLARVRGGKETT